MRECKLFGWLAIFFYLYGRGWKKTVKKLSTAEGKASIHQLSVLLESFLPV